MTPEDQEAATRLAVRLRQLILQRQIAWYAGCGKINLPGGRRDDLETELASLVPGLRAGHYLCFFGLHVFTPGIMDILAHMAGQDRDGVTLSRALALLAAQERYLALERPWFRYDVGVQYGLLIAQLALALSGRDRDLVLTQLLELLAATRREIQSSREAA